MVPVSLSSIEQAMLAAVRGASLRDGCGMLVHEFDIREDVSNVTRFPAVCVALERVAYRKIDNDIIEWKPTFGLYCLFQGLMSDQARRKGVYGVVEGAVRLLTFSKVGLDISPLVPVASEEVKDDNLRARKLMGFATLFETTFESDAQYSADGAVPLIVSSVDLLMQAPAGTEGGESAVINLGDR